MFNRFFLLLPALLAASAVLGVNDRAAKLLAVSAGADGERWGAEVRIPYSVASGNARAPSRAAGARRPRRRALGK